MSVQVTLVLDLEKGVGTGYFSTQLGESKDKDFQRNKDSERICRLVSHPWAWLGIAINHQLEVLPT